MPRRTLAAALLLITGILTAGCDDHRRRLDDFEPLLGRWEGQLEYLDYQDDSTRVRLPVTMEARREFSTLQMSKVIAFRFTFAEPDGTSVEGKTVFRPLSDGSYYLDERWDTDEESIDRMGRSYRIVLSGRGIDNNRTANFRQVLTLQNDTLAIRKFVTYEGASDELERNAYVLTRIDG